jgi:cyclopropane-fatty-acyl-phospholipid synthase
VSYPLSVDISAVIQVSKPRRIDKYARANVLARFEKISRGQIRIIDSTGERVFGQCNAADDLQVDIRVIDQRFYSDLAFGGTVAAGESYMQGCWHCSDLTGLIRIMVRNRNILEAVDGRLSYFKRPILRLGHWLNRNTQSGSRRNIEAHYDLGNDMFELFLDPTMMYSGAYYPEPTSTLGEAAVAKLKRICDKLQLCSDDHVIEIGTGWGGFAIYAASHYGCKVTTTTISKEQHAMAVSRVVAAGLQDRVTLLMEDYRDLTGEYDKLVSIEMIEAVGHQYLDTYFSKCSSLLKAEGIMLIQAITIADQQYDSAVNSVDFIQRYIFPGGFIPSVSAITQSVKVSTDMRLFHLEDIGPHYATTLQHWRERFFENIDSIRALGYSEQFIRMWEFYLCYSEGGFLERALGDAHLVFIKPDNRIDWRLMSTR